LYYTGNILKIAGGYIVVEHISYIIRKMRNKNIMSEKWRWTYALPSNKNGKTLEKSKKKKKEKKNREEGFLYINNSQVDAIFPPLWLL